MESGKVFDQLINHAIKNMGSWGDKKRISSRLKDDLNDDYGSNGVCFFDLYDPISKKTPVLDQVVSLIKNKKLKLMIASSPAVNQRINKITDLVKQELFKQFTMDFDDGLRDLAQSIQDEMIDEKFYEEERIRNAEEIKLEEEAWKSAQAKLKTIKLTKRERRVLGL